MPDHQGILYKIPQEYLEAIAHTIPTIPYTADELFAPCRFTAQVKCVRKTKLTQNENGVFYKLRKKNYDTLIKSQPNNTIILIVLVVPDEPIDWVISTDSDITIKHNCYWFCLQDSPLSKLKHQDSKEQIQLLEDQLLTPERGSDSPYPQRSGVGKDSAAMERSEIANHSFGES